MSGKGNVRSIGTPGPKTYLLGKTLELSLKRKSVRGPRVNVESEISVNVICWSLSSVLNFDLRDHPAINFEMVNRTPRDKHICSKFPLGVYLSRLPKAVCAYEQRDSEERHYGGTDRDYFGVVFADKFEKSRDVATLFFFFLGPLIGFFLLFVNEWIGRAILLSWLLFIFYVLSGLWLYVEHPNR